MALEIRPPDCSAYPTPCSEKDWAQCDRCYAYVCEVHDYLVDVRHPGTNPNRGTSRLCNACILHFRTYGGIGVGLDGCCFSI